MDAADQPTAAPPLPPRARLLLLGALGVIVAISWLYLAAQARQGRDPVMVGMAMEPGPRGAAEVVLLCTMWAVMMVAMMLPTAAPAILLYAAVVRRLPSVGAAPAMVAAFVAAYVVVWTGFALGAAVLQSGLERLALLSPMMVSTSPLFGGALLVAAGLYQITPLKDLCVRRCQAPIFFITQHWRPGTGGAFRMGLRHGAYCAGCCWILMGLLFVVGVMNLLWVAAITVFVLLEKLTPVGGLTGRRLSAIGLVAAGAFVLFVGRS